MYTITNLPKYLTQGNQGEKDVTSFTFDFSIWKTAHPTGEITLHVIRPTETITNVYWPISTTIDEEHSTITWNVDDYDTQWPGRGSLSFIMTDVGNTFRLQSATVATVIVENLALYGTYPLPVIVDATATAEDILFPKTAYVNTGKATGSCTYDADTGDATAAADDILLGETAYVNGAKITGILEPLDTSDATAAETDIVLGETAYVNGVKLTGTNTNNANTTDATATADSLLYGHTAYGAAGTEITGTGAYWQSAKETIGTFRNNTALTSINLYVPLSSTLTSCLYGCTNLVTASVAVGAALTSVFYLCANCSNLETMTITGSTQNVTNWRYAFQYDSKLTTINGSLDMTAATQNDGMFQGANALAGISFVANTVKIDISFYQSPLLSTASLLSIANGLNAGTPATLTMHATSKTNMGNINVDVVGGVAVLGTTKSLTAFITDAAPNGKGWTIA